MATEAAAINPLKPPLSAMRTERDRFAALAFCWADILLELNGAAKVVYASGATDFFIGCSASDLIGQPFQKIVATEDRAMVDEILRVALGRGRIGNRSVRLLGEKGPSVPLVLTGYRLDDLNGHYFFALRANNSAQLDEDETGLVREENTGLYDGNSFPDMVVRHLGGVSADAEQQMTLIALSEYEALRQRLPGSVEQRLLKNLGTCLKDASANGDAAGRIAADRYGLLHDTDLDVGALEEQIAELTREADPKAEGVSVQSATIDIDGDVENDEEFASGLVYTINRFQSFQGSDFSLNSLSNSMSVLANEAIQSVAALKHLIGSADFEIAFQPIIDVKTGSVHHYEALARFPAHYGERSPYEHITLAEQTGLISDFDLAMAAKVVEWLRTKTSVNSKTSLAVNVSGQSVGSLSFLARLDALLKEHPWVRGRLMFEITESARIEDLEAANKFIQRLRSQGFPVCLDDFGAGAANFEYLSSLEVDIVKLDGPALQTARSAQKGKAFLKAFIGLCRNLGVATVGEMIDSETSLKFVRDCGVQYVQGYLFGQPSTDIHVFKDAVPMHLFPNRTRK